MASKSDRPFAKPRKAAVQQTMRKTPRQTRAKNTVDAIHEAAFQVLQSVGPDRFTTTRVATRAGVSVGTLYQYYSNKDSLVYALIVAYLGRVERVMYEVLDEKSSLPALARSFVRRFIAFKLEGAERGAALRGVFFSGVGRTAANEATTSLVVALAKGIQERKPSWPLTHATEIANMWASLVFGGTSALLERAPQLVGEAWFADSLERAVLALLRDSRRTESIDL